MALSIIIALTSFLLLVVTYVINFRKKNMPPGPYGLPFVGYGPFLGKNPIATMTNLKKRYGSVVGLTLGMQNVVILNDWETIKIALVKQGTTFSGRPHLFWQRKVFSVKGIIYNEGVIWKEQRHFSLQALKNFGFGQSSMENVIMYEMDKLTEYLNNNVGTPIKIPELFGLPTLNIIWNNLSGNRFNEIDENVRVFKDFLHNLTNFGTYNIVNSFPLLRFIHPKWKREFQKFITGANALKNYLNEEVTNHETNFQENNLKDFIDVYLAEIYKFREKNGKDAPPYDREHLVSSLIDIYFGGQSTMETTMSWALLYMVDRPDIQQKVQQELDSVVGIDSFLSTSSKALAPYTEATLLEIQRHPTIAPLSAPHCVTNDTTLLGYTIPKGTMVYPNIYAVHHDERYWEDPDTFRPERFLDEARKNIIKPECFIPFSVGPRACMGDTMAKLEIHLLFTSLLRRFTFEAVPGQPKPTVKPIPGNVFKTHPFSLIVRPR